MGLKEFFQELKRVSQPKDEEFDEETMAALAEMGLLDDGTAHIESNSCIWNEPPKTKGLSDKYKGEIDAAAAMKKARTKAARQKGEDNSRVN